MRVIKMRIKMVIVLIVLVQATNLTPMVGNLLNGENHNPMVEDNIMEVSNLLKADNPKVVADNVLKVANKNHLVADNLVIHLQRIHKVALK
jgi:hypothetical protein